MAEEKEKELDPTRFIPFKVLATKDTPVGFETESFTKKWTLDSGRIRGYGRGRLSWPYGANFHTGFPEAQHLGFHAPVAAGGQEMEWGAELLVKFFGENYLGGGISCTFINLVWPEDEVTIKGVIKERIPEGDAVRLVVDILAENQRGEKIFAATGSGVVR